MKETHHLRHLMRHNGGLYIGGAESGIYHGLATQDALNVTLGDRAAELIPLEDKDMKIWIFFNPTSEDTANKLLFLDKDGRILN
jgi:hypothetical protein